MFGIGVLLLEVAAGHAQAPPPQPPPTAAPEPAPPSVSSFVPPYEIMRTVRSAGFDPLAPPLREGTTYVLRATDYRGILMRVVVDARSGAIRDANRIVPGPGAYGYDQVGLGPPRYGLRPDEPLPAYGAPPGFDAPEMPPSEDSALPRSPRSTAAHATRSGGTAVPPLPRPRPPQLASRKPAEEVKPEVAPSVIPGKKVDLKPPSSTEAKPELNSKPEAKPGAASDTKSDQKSDVTTAAPPPPSAPPPVKPNRPAPPPPIND
jgi:hypothetical protein